MTPVDSNVPQNVALTKNGDTYNTAWGVASTGAFFFGAISENIVDPFYPDYYGSVTSLSDALEKTDWCLAHPQESGIYHYHSASTCIANSSLGSTNGKMSADMK